ncbi:MAG: beta-lactamase family protein [Kordiimonadaceae bacterium]|nr:beta-lactamase family protein [Kordiimonadaceae bacterium]MBT6036957.1 beta-lactamase family protein [Kordiimonadaceae bacterium]MBT6330002.1 beta-lactamase family protein [Kordiimonadaceae bacterium]MBT7583455.1 beta-lactamase family protein [Kordiimonadaceae bacterium]
MKMQLHFKIGLGLIITLLYTANGFAQTATDIADKMFSDATALPGVPGINVAVANESGVLWADGFGFANIEYDLPMIPATKMRIGSVAKVITTAALMKMVERGKIDLDTDIRDYVPEWPAKHAKITIRQLTAHVSGVRHYAGNEFASNVEYENSIAALSMFKDSPLKFAPGSDYSYSTYAWTLIAAAMESVSGNDFKAIIRDEVLNPLNMTGTTFDDAAPLIENRQGSYDYVGGALVNTPAVNNSYKYAGGGFLATPTDIVNFAMAHTKSGYLKSETLDEMFTILPPSFHGIGWVVGFDRYLNNFSGDMLAIMKEHPNTVMHSGGSAGGLTMMMLCLDHNRAVALTKNVGNGSDANHFELALRTLDIFHKND